jgi:hypothetical protein
MKLTVRKIRRLAMGHGQLALVLIIFHLEAAEGPAGILAARIAALIRSLEIEVFILVPESEVVTTESAK